MTLNSYGTVNDSCSICVKKQNRHFIVPAADFTLLKGHDSLSTYTFNTHQAKHNFCSRCGVQSFYIPRSNPDGIGVMPHCLDDGIVQKVNIRKFNGDEWEQSMDNFPQIKDLSKK